MSGKKQYFFDKPKNVKLVLYSLYVCCGFLLVADFVVHRHVTHQWEQLLGFYSIYGFIGCTAIVLGSKWLRSMVEREEDYYDQDELRQNGGDDHVA